MGSNKKDLEIIYNLQWKNGNGTSYNDKSNIVGMYDIPSTTLNWETFKSYLLKNSGAIADDVKVSYLSSDEKEFPIESQLDFQIALYSFRQRARNNDVITLMLERFSDKQCTKRVRRSVEKCVATVPAFDDVPDWFRNFMKEYKKEIVDEVTTSVVNAISNTKLQSLGRKLKENPTKRLRKTGDNEKEIKKTLKLERKIEELEEKTNKIKEKKFIGLQMEGLEEKTNKNKIKGYKFDLPHIPPCGNCAIGLQPEQVEGINNKIKGHKFIGLQMEGLEEKTNKKKIKGNKFDLPRIPACGNCAISLQLQQVERNTNKIIGNTFDFPQIPAYGIDCAIDLPIDTAIVMNATPNGKAEVVVTHMTGGEICRIEWLVTNTGSIAWTLNTELRYAWGSESLKPIKNTVSCPLLKPGEVGSVIAFLETPKVAGEYESYWHFYHEGRRFGHWLGCHINVDAHPLEMLSQPCTSTKYERFFSSPSIIEDSPNHPTLLIKEMNSSNVLDDITLTGSDSDNQSIISVADSNSSAHSAHSDAFVVVPIESETEPIKPPINMEELEYAYINIDGKKQAVPKMLLRKDFLETAEEVKAPESDENPDNKRLFVFPLNCPGFEVVYPPNPMSESLLATADPRQREHDPQLVIKTEKESEAPIVETKVFKEEPNAPPVNNTIFPTGPSMFPRVPIFPTAINIPPIPIPPPPPITIPVPAPPRIQMPPPRIFTYNAPSNPSPGLFYSAVNGTTPQFVPCGPPPSHNFSYPYMPTYIYPNLETNSPLLTQLQPPEGSGPTSPNNNNNGPTPPPQAHIIPETLVSGAVNVASSAINTARSVLNMFTSSAVPQMQPMPHMSQTTSLTPEAQVDPNSPQEKALKILQEMGFGNRELNVLLLAHYENNVERVISELLP